MRSRAEDYRVKVLRYSKPGCMLQACRRSPWTVLGGHPPWNTWYLTWFLNEYLPTVVFSSWICTMLQDITKIWLNNKQYVPGTYLVKRGYQRGTHARKRATHAGNISKAEKKGTYLVLQLYWYTHVRANAEAGGEPWREGETGAWDKSAYRLASQPWKTLRTLTYNQVPGRYW